jgi:hypothetical protein
MVLASRLTTARRGGLDPLLICTSRLITGPLWTVTGATPLAP